MEDGRESKLLQDADTLHLAVLWTGPLFYSCCQIPLTLLFSFILLDIFFPLSVQSESPVSGRFSGQFWRIFPVILKSC